MGQHDALTTTDVAVVGGGLAGMTVAYELRSRGFDVTVLEQRFAGFGASGRNPGALWQQTCRTGTELRLAKAGALLYEEYISELGDVFDFRRRGGLFFYETDEQQHVLGEYVADRAAQGLDIHMLTRKQALKHSALLPSTALGAVYCSDDAQLDSRRFVEAVANSCVRKGVKIFDNTAVLSTIRRGDTVTGLRTVRGNVYAAGVVWATGAWTRNLAAEGVDLPLTNARRGQIRTQPLSHPDHAIMHGPRGVRSCGALTDLPAFRSENFAPPEFSSHQSDPGEDESSWDYDDTLVAGSDGSLHIGSSLDATDSLNPHISIRATHAMIDLASERFPDRGQVGIIGLWAGLHSDTPDHLPIVDRVDGCYASTGHSAGIGTAPISGRVLARLIAGENDEFSDDLRADRPALAYPGSISAVTR